MKEQNRNTFLKPGLPTHKELESVILIPINQWIKRKNKQQE